MLRNNIFTTLARPTPLTLALLAAALLPIAYIPIPAMVDYLNHLARMQLLAGSTPHPAYLINWQLVPNLAMDLVVPTLAQAMPVAVASRLFLAVSLALVVTGSMAIEHVVAGRHRFAGLCALAVLFCQPIAWGLVNFIFGLGVALWAMAFWIGSEGWPWPRRFVMHTGFCALLFAAHFLALGFYGVVAGLFSFAPLLNGRMRLAEAARLVAVLASPVLVLLVIMIASGGSMGGSGVDWNFGLKLQWLATFMNLYNPLVSLASAAVVAMLIIWLVRRRDATFTPVGRIIAIGLLLLYLALPRLLFSVAFLDVRVLLLAALVLPAFVTVRPSRGAAIVLVGLAVANAAVTLSAWVGHQRDYAEFRSSFAHLTPGSAVLIGGGALDALFDPPLFYAATLAVPERQVFVASFYAFPGVQPVVAAPDFRDLSPRTGLDHLPVPLANLDTPSAPVHAQNWRCRYEYLYVLGAPTAPLSGLLEIAHGRRFVLYHISTPADCRHK